MSESSHPRSIPAAVLAAEWRLYAPDADKMAKRLATFDKRRDREE